MGIPFDRAKVGDRYVLEMLQEKGWQLGGENSGHILCLDRHSSGDGIVSALQVLQALRQSGQTLAEAAAGLQLYPQVLINVPVVRGFDFRARAEVIAAQDEATRALEGSGRVLLRPSGTEPVLRVMVEGRDASAVEHWASRLATVVREAAE